ncbi:MAG: hypothetical protein AAGA48_24510 [Myxococcota bacterium]
MQQPSVDDSRETWLVYADALQEAGDVRGKLILLNDQVASGADPAERDAYIDAHLTELFGSLSTDFVEVEWRYSVPLTVALHVSETDQGADLAQRLLDAPIAKGMRQLRLVGRTPSGEPVDLESAVAVLAPGLPPSCDTFELIDDRADGARVLVSSDYDPRENLVSFGPIAKAIPAHLKAFRVVTADADQLDLSDLAAPELAQFELACLRWGYEGWNEGSALGTTLGEAEFPNLRRLALRIPETLTYSWPSTDGAYHPNDRYNESNDYYSDDEEGWSEGFDWTTELAPILEGLRDTRLEELSLTSFISGSSVLEALAESGLPEGLRILDLSDSDLSNGDLSIITQNSQVFEKLEVIDLRGTFVSDASELSSLNAEVRVEPGQGHRYQFSVGME